MYTPLGAHMQKWKCWVTGIKFLSFMKFNTKCFPKWSYQFIFPLSDKTDPAYLQPLVQSEVLSDFLIFANPRRCYMVSDYGLVFTSLINRGWEAAHIFWSFLQWDACSCCLPFFFLLGCLFLICKNFYNASLLLIFYSCMCYKCLLVCNLRFHFLKVSSDEQKHFVLIKSNLPIFYDL